MKNKLSDLIAKFRVLSRNIPGEVKEIYTKPNTELRVF